MIESKAYPWFGILGNSRGHGRPSRILSTAPLSCTPRSKAEPCLPPAALEPVRGVTVATMDKIVKV